MQRGRLLAIADGEVHLSESGRQRGLQLLRSHRLWETYLAELGLPADHLHDPADALEHFIDGELRQEIDAQVADAQVDPQGKEIPRED